MPRRDGRRARPRQAAKDEDEAAQRGKGGGSDRNPKLWCHVTYIGEIEGESHREPRGESTVTCRYIGEGNMGHMGLTLWALTPPFKLKVEAEDLKH